MKIALLLIALVLMAGCATYQPKPISPSQVASEFEARTLDNPRLKQFIEMNLGHEISPWPPKSWDIHMLTLAAFYYHPDLDVARAKWGVAQAGVITAGGRPNPSFGFLPRYSTNPPSGVSPWYLAFNLDIPIETAGKRGYRLEQAKHLSEAARLDIARATWQVRGRLYKSLLDLYTANKTGTILSRKLAVQEELNKALEQRFTHGAASRPDVTEARLSLEQVRLSAHEAQRQAADARVQLADALGLQVGALNGADISVDFLERITPASKLPAPELRRQALLTRPDIVAALSRYDASQSALQLEIAKQYPDVHLSPGFIWDQGQNWWSLGVSAILPIFNQNQGPIAEAEARRRLEAAAFTALQAKVIGEIDLALASYCAVLQKLEMVESLLPIQQKKLQSTQAMFNAGETDRLALLSAQLELETSTLSRLTTFVDVQQSKRSIEDAIQRPIGPTGPLDVVVPDTDPRAEEINNK